MKKNNNPDKKHFYVSLTIPLILVTIIMLSFILEKGMGWSFTSGGILPRHTDKLWGILTHSLVHGDWEHLLNNCSSIFILTTALYYFYSSIASRVLLLSFLISGSILWIIGRESWHIGASGIVYALSFFLFTSGVLRKHIPLIAISLCIVFWYGGLIWSIFPIKTEQISWEGHLSGAITGVTLALIFRKKGPQKPIKIWDEENEEDAENEYDEELEKLEIKEEEEKKEEKRNKKTS